VRFRIPFRVGAEKDSADMSLADHLRELRYRLIVSVLAVVVLMIPAWFLYPWLIELLNSPYCDALVEVDPTSDCDFLVTNLLDPFTLRLRVAGYGGLFLAMPVILWQLWRFIAPGLYRRERRYALAFGVGFLFPVVLVSLQLIGVVKPQQLSRWRRHTILAVVVIAAAITPSGDPFTLGALSVPMYLFYELSLLIGRLALRRRARRDREREATR